jgi:hypothetical protein
MAVPITSTAAGAAATGMTVGDVCSSSSSSRHLAAALRKWAELSHPGRPLTPAAALNATRVADLLPHLGKFVQYVDQQMAEGGRAAAAAKAQAEQL